MSSSYPYLMTISNGVQICRHQLNLSPAKQQYSFPHEERFRNSTLRFNCKAEYYTVNDKLFRTQRSCSLGKGTRYDFAKNSREAPPPNTYFPKNKSIAEGAKKGFSFGLSRESCPHLSIVPFIKSVGQKPGPGAYTPVLPKTGRVTTFHIRAKSIIDNNPNLGPGKYEVQSSFQPSKSILNSKFRSAKTTKFAPPNVSVLRMSAKLSEARKSAHDKVGLELAQDKTYQINRTGTFFNSKYKNSLCRYFGKENRDANLKFNENPGPGTYMPPSEFGLYESSKIHGSEKLFK